MPLTTSSRHSSSSLKTSSASYPYTRAGSFTSQTSSAPLSAIMSTTPVTSKILITGLSINRVLSNSPILNPTPVLRQLSLSVRNLSSTHIFASTASEAHTADTHSSVQNDATSGNAEHRAEANNTSDAVVSTESTVCLQHYPGLRAAVCFVCLFVQNVQDGAMLCACTARSCRYRSPRLRHI